MALPFVVDVNKYRPQIVAAANEHLNGKLELGALKLSFWGRVKVDIDGLSIADAHGKRVLSVKDAAVNVPLLPLLIGAPSLSLLLNEPELNVVKGQDGKLNLMTLVKSEAGPQGAPGAPSAPGQKAAVATGDGVALPAIVLRSRFTLLMDHAKVSYRDAVAGASYDVKDLSFHLRDVSPTSRMPFDLVAVLDITMGKTLKVKGPLRLEGSLQAAGGAQPFDKLDAQASLQLDDLDLESPGSLSKRAGVPLRLDVTASVSPEGTNVPSLKLRLADVIIDGKASTKNQGAVTLVDAEIQSNRIELGKLGAIFPAVAENGLNGNVELAAKAQGPSDQLGYSANVKFDGVTAKTATMSEALNLSGALDLAANELKRLQVAIRSESVEGNLTGQASNLAAPRFRFTFISKHADLDKLFPASSTAQAASAPAGGAGGKATGGGKGSGDAAAVDYNRMLDPLRGNPTVAKANGSFDFSIERLTTAGVSLRGVKGQVILADLLLQLKGFSFQAFDGGFKMDASLNAKNPKPIVGVNMELAGMNTQKMAESRMSFAKNSMSGIVSGKLNIGGTGLNRPEINSSWKGGGQFDIKNAKFSSMDVGKQIKTGVMDKLPDFLKSRVRISDKLMDWKGEYTELSTRFALNNGTLTLTELTGKAPPQRGLDLKGSGTLSIADYSMDMNADFIDHYGLLGNLPKDRRFNAAAVSARMRGTMMDPQYDWGYTLQQLAKNTLQDAAKEKAGGAVKKELEKLAVPDAARNLLKKFF